jgi:hypothetical protein
MIDQFEFAKFLARCGDVSGILGTDRAVRTLRQYEKPSFNYSGGGDMEIYQVSALMAEQTDDEKRDWLMHRMEEALKDNAAYCEACDVTWPASCWTLDPEGERCNFCIEAIPSAEEMASIRGDIAYDEWADGERGRL